MDLASTSSLGSHLLPEDVMREILFRLPLKSLLRFRCVSKSWLALVDHDAKFATWHLENFKHKCDQTHLLVDRKAKVLKLWNPSLRHFSVVPPPPTASYMTTQIIGLGYDLQIQDYKIVMLIYYIQSESDVMPEVAIYTVGANSWKTIPFRVGEGSSRCQRHWGYTHFSGSVFLQGRLYFVTKDTYKDVVWDLISFDLSKEVFSCTSMPADPSIGYLKPVLIDGGSSVALCGWSRFVWVLDRETMNWTKREGLDSGMARRMAMC